jgi:hypothetical protein
MQKKTHKRKKTYGGGGKAVTSDSKYVCMYVFGVLNLYWCHWRPNFCTNKSVSMAMAKKWNVYIVSCSSRKGELKSTFSTLQECQKKA